jgi:L,D-peptidoglycan transpeptidase YkuD (ErfK/YbiS/YcfS/YnhG family)
MKSPVIFSLFFAVLLLSFPVEGLSGFSPECGPDPDRLDLGDSGQVLVVQAGKSESAAAEAVAWERSRSGRWQPAFGPLPAVIGGNGFAPAGGKREGDGRTPSGVFLLGFAFGYGPSAPTRMPYRQAQNESIWVDDASSPDYNRWTTKGASRASSFEWMKRKDGLYRYGLVVEYNMNPVVSGKGSAIFLHVWKGPGEPTAGCVALAEPDVLRILGWLDPALKPAIALGIQENRKKRKE